MLLLAVTTLTSVSMSCMIRISPNISTTFWDLLQHPVPSRIASCELKQGSQNLLSSLARTSHTLGIPDCLTPDIMHLAQLLSDLLLSLWRGTIDCTLPDPVSTWPWAVFRDVEIWETHGEAVSDAAQHLPESFDRKPRNPTEKFNSGYKTWEYQVYIFGLVPCCFITSYLNLIGWITANSSMEFNWLTSTSSA